MIIFKKGKMVESSIPFCNKVNQLQSKGVAIDTASLDFSSQ